MKCIIVDDEPIVRKGIRSLVARVPELELLEMFNNASSAADYLTNHPVELIFLDIQMPGVTGIEFARDVPKTTLIIFTTAYTEFALDSYEVDAVDYLVKPIEFERFRKAVDKALNYYSLLTNGEKEDIEQVEDDYLFVKSERRYFKVNFEDILFIEGLKDYVILQLTDQRVITKMSLKAIHEQLPRHTFFRINKSYIVNTLHINSFDNNDVFIRMHEIAIGNNYREEFFDKYVMKKKNRK
ncbi:LytR/AlgR family response regulator transcription factor [Butyricimonas muris]|uniref:LytR/AlgR family response regulator transcription factor n=1 Tax=Butyricimonas muris TaxID=3378067 RepID=UPI003967D907